MSLERYAANENLADEVQGVDRLPFQGPVGALANLLVNDARAELISLNRGPNSPISSVLTVDRPANLPKRDFAYTNKIEALIYWGNAVVSFDEIFRNGEYNHGDYVDRVNYSIGQYGGNTISGETPATFTYSDQALRNLSRIVQEDPTFSIFIIERSQLLPDKLLDLWTRKKVIQPMIQMLPSYVKAARRVIVKNPEPYSRLSYQHQVLKRFDEDYEDLFGNSVII